MLGDEIVRELIATLLAAVGFVCLGTAIWGLFAGVGTLGEVWYLTDRGSLNAAQALTQRYLLPELWDPGMVTLLLQPAPVVGLIASAILLALAWLLLRR